MKSIRTKKVMAVFVLLFISGIGIIQAARAFFPSPTEDAMASALKEALSVGTDKAVSFLNKPGGYLDNARFKIPFPPEATKVASALREAGYGSKVDKFVASLNKSAENAAIEAKPIFVNALQKMTLNDAKNILLGADNSATQYFQSKTYDGLQTAFSPKIKKALDGTNAATLWTDITKTYNKIPFVKKKAQTDLVKYTTGKALDGLFLKLAEEEKDIRTNISARPSDLLKDVFGWASSLKK